MKRTFCTIAAAISILAPALPAAAATLDDIMAQLKEMQQDNQAIRRDNEQLRKEVAALRRERSPKEVAAVAPANAPSRDLPRSVSSAMAAAPPANSYYKAVPVSGPYDWSGFYVGLNAGYGAGRDHMVQNIGSESEAAAGRAFDGLSGGIQLGSNWQYGAVVLGLEADMQYASIGGKIFSSTTDLGTVQVFNGTNDRMDAFGTIRGRLGYAFDRLLIYGTGGIAAAHVTQQDTSVTEFVDPTPVVVSGYETDSAILKGWAAGAGLEYAVHGGWSVKAEYLHLAFSNKSFFDGDSTSKISFDLVRAGANYHF